MVAVPPMGNRDFQMKNLTIIAFLMASTSLASAAENESFIGQIGNHIFAVAGQDGGNNTQNTLQVGKKNGALTVQDTAGSRTNNSNTLQFGGYNGSIASQKGGNNEQTTIQGGVGNFALTKQKGTQTNGKLNDSTTAQFGAFNASIADQKDGNNKQGTLQVGVGNFAATSQESPSAWSGNWATNNFVSSRAASKAGTNCPLPMGR